MRINLTDILAFDTRSQTLYCRCDRGLDRDKLYADLSSWHDRTASASQLGARGADGRFISAVTIHMPRTVRSYFGEIIVHRCAYALHILRSHTREADCQPKPVWIARAIYAAVGWASVILFV